MEIIDETLKAVAVEISELRQKYNHVTEEDYEYIAHVKQWIPKSLCKIDGNQVIEVEHWFALKNMLYPFLDLVEENGRKFYR